MKHKNLIITGAIFAVLLIYVLMTQTGDKGFNTLTLPKIPTITYENLEKITVQKSGETIIFSKQEEAWQITEPINFPAEKQKMDSLTRMLGEILITNLVTEQAEQAADFGLNSQTAMTLILAGDNKTVELRLGAVNKSSTHTYVQLPGDQKIYQLLGDFTQQLNRPALEWRSLRVYDFSTDQVTGLSIEQKGKPALRIAKEQEVKEEIVKHSAQGVTPPALPARMVWKEKNSNTVLNDPKVNQLLNAFTRLAAHKILDTHEWQKKPIAQVKVQTLEGEKVLEILQFQEKEQKYLVRRADDTMIYEIGKYQGDNLLKTVEELK
ncbi:DUF4340 domain-containing protein [bacterium]|nr:DUF4340 domain-containing protein [bacterium]